MFPVYENTVTVLSPPTNDQMIITLESIGVYLSTEAVTSLEGKFCLTYPTVGRLSVPIRRHVRKPISQFVSVYACDSMLDAQAEKNTRTQSAQDLPTPKYTTELLTGLVLSTSTNPEVRWCTLYTFRSEANRQSRFL